MEGSGKAQGRLMEGSGKAQGRFMGSWKAHGRLREGSWVHGRRLGGGAPVDGNDPLPHIRQLSLVLDEREGVA